MEGSVLGIDDEPSFSDHITERVIHELLPVEGSGGVGESKEHDGGFE